MKATGIVRRIDELGRVVVPKEIRRTLRIREGDPLEIFTDREGEVILKKYSPIGELGEFSIQYAQALSQSTGHMVCILDRDHVIAVSGGGKSELLQKPVAKDVEKIIEKRQVVLITAENQSLYPFVEGMDMSYTSQVIVPIICQGDAIGAVVIMSKTGEKMGETEKKLAITAASFLGKQMEQ